MTLNNFKSIFLGLVSLYARYIIRHFQCDHCDLLAPCQPVYMLKDDASKPGSKGNWFAQAGQTALQLDADMDPALHVLAAIVGHTGSPSSLALAQLVTS